MTPKKNLRVFAPVLTPFKADGSVDHDAFIAFCQSLLKENAGLAVFGTNSESNSLSLDEKLDLLECLSAAKVDPKSLMPGVGLCSLDETRTLTRRAVELGCHGVLVLPPFYFKPVTDDGLFAYYDQLIQSIGSTDFKLYLYHIPQLTGVPVSVDLIARLQERYPNTIAGVKDSSGDWSNTEAMLKRFPTLEIYPASEALLDKSLPLGAAGCVSATANIQAGRIHEALQAWGTPQFDDIFQEISRVREVYQRYPMIPALKYVASTRFADFKNVVRVPLSPLAAELATGLTEELSALATAVS